MTVSVLLLTHEQIGQALLKTASNAFPDLPLPVTTIGISYDIEPIVFLPYLQSLIQRVDTGSGVLVLADIFGATPCNMMQNLLDHVAKRAEVIVITGLNLPMLLSVLNYATLGLTELANKALQSGRRGVIQCSTSLFRSEQKHVTKERDHH